MGLRLPQRQPGEKEQAQIARAQIGQAEGAGGKIPLGELLEADQQGKDQAAGQRDPLPAARRKRTKERQIEQ